MIFELFCTSLKKVQCGLFICERNTHKKTLRVGKRDKERERERKIQNLLDQAHLTRERTRKEVRERKKEREIEIERGGNHSLVIKLRWPQF